MARHRFRRIVLGMVTCTLVCAQFAGSQNSAKNTRFHWDWHSNLKWTTGDSLRELQPPEQDKKAIALAIEKLIMPTMKELGTDSKEQLHGAALKTDTKMVDLNSDGTSEVAAQSAVDCSPTGNCSLWIFQKQSAGYRLILSGYGQTFTIQSRKTNRYNDVVVAMHGSATSSDLTDFRYRDGKYRRIACYTADFEVLEGERVRRLKDPRITPVVCERY